MLLQQNVAELVAAITLQRFVEGDHGMEVQTNAHLLRDGGACGERQENSVRVHEGA